MKTSELKLKTVDELKEMILNLRKEQFNLRFQKSMGQLESTAQIRKNRKSIARVSTFITINSEGK